MKRWWAYRERKVTQQEESYLGSPLHEGIPWLVEEQWGSMEGKARKGKPEKKRGTR